MVKIVIRSKKKLKTTSPKFLETSPWINDWFGTGRLEFFDRRTILTILYTSKGQVFRFFEGLRQIFQVFEDLGQVFDLSQTCTEPVRSKTVPRKKSISYSSVLEFKESNPPNQTNEPTKKESSRKKKNRIKMSRKFPFMKSIEDVSKIDNLNGSHSASLNQYKVSFTEITGPEPTFRLSER